MGSKKCFNAKKFFFLFFPEYLPLILGVPINVGVPNPNFRGTYPPKYHFFLFYFLTLPLNNVSSILILISMHQKLFEDSCMITGKISTSQKLLKGIMQFR